jgi:hypothetical protein
VLITLILSDKVCGTRGNCHLQSYSSISKYKLRLDEIKVTFGDISLKLRQTNWNVAKNNVNVVVDELSSPITIYTCLTIDVWTPRRRRTSTRFYV